MPTYEYECARCQKTFEVFQKMTDAPLKKCVTCNSRRVKRLLGSGSGIIFKGTGFYETDYKRKTQSKSAESKPAAEKKSDAPKPAKSSDAKA